MLLQKQGAGILMQGENDTGSKEGRMILHLRTQTPQDPRSYSQTFDSASTSRARSSFFENDFY